MRPLLLAALLFLNLTLVWAADPASIGLIRPDSEVDLTKIDRTILKEPAYGGKPKYCLLVFGPKAKTRVWLALDGNHLYVDKNANGDLTEQGDCVPKTNKHVGHRVGGTTYNTPQPESVEVVTYVYNVGFDDPNADDAYYSISVRPNERGMGLVVVRPGKVRYIVGNLYDDPDGGNGAELHFADRPRDAPIIHLDGPLKIRLADRPPTFRAGQDCPLAALCGTPGLGAGTFAGVYRDEGMNVAIEFPASGTPEGVLRESFGLVCDASPRSIGKVKVPKNVSTGKAKVTLTLSESKHVTVSPSTLEVPVEGE